MSKVARKMGLFYKFSKIEDGNMSYVFGSAEEITRNRKVFLAKYNIDTDQCVGAYLTHSKKVAIADKDLVGVSVTNVYKMPRVDGLLTDQKNLFILMTFADCLPVILYDPVRRVAGLIHAGWKGTEKNIVGVAVKKMVDVYKSKPEDVKVDFGPCVTKESYIFENPIKTKLANKKLWKSYLDNVGDGKYSIDLVRFNTENLISEGVSEKNIRASGVNTGTSGVMYSHYRDSRSKTGDVGRFAVVVGMR
ncbi:polyphenol oxidase family protein [Patescibacteria group bacterium]